ncbi:nucleotidyltransferase family protein [Solwaraspora sp. WMMB335]|uniref:nucleotidyltransferase family protein n=1 Tax=Solwaraspora sp. WMMB335 TaxID=3404118 RepID=UPI003B96460D
MTERSANPHRGLVLAGLLLAAGAGRRYGRPKALLDHGGKPLVDRTVEVLWAAGCRPVLVVVGAQADQVRAVAGRAGAQVVDNPDWPSGMASSLRCGLAALAGTAADAVAVLLVDMPGVGAGAVRRVAAGADRRTLAAASYAGRQGHPVVLGRDHWPGAAAAATGDTGARTYLRTHRRSLRLVPCADIADPTDLDRPVDRTGVDRLEVDP